MIQIRFDFRINRWKKNEQFLTKPSGNEVREVDGRGPSSVQWKSPASWRLFRPSKCATLDVQGTERCKCNCRWTQEKLWKYMKCHQRRWRRCQSKRERTRADGKHHVAEAWRELSGPEGSRQTQLTQQQRLRFRPARICSHRFPVCFRTQVDWNSWRTTHCWVPKLQLNLSSSLIPF